MSKIIIKVEKDDINTSILGQNIELKLNDSLSIIFSSEALDELINDYQNLKKYKKRQ